MKKLLLVLILAVAVGIVSVLWIRSQMGVADPASLVPQNVVAYAALQDLPRSLLRWNSTALARIAAEKEVSAFLKKPLDFLARKQGGEEAGQILAGLKPGRLFVAILSLEGTPKVLLGFQFWGSRKDFDQAITRLRQEISEKPLPEPHTENSGDGEFFSAETRQGRMFWGVSGRWGFLSNDRAAILAGLQRARSTRADGPSLAQDAQFEACRQALVKDPDLLLFIKPEPLVGAVVEAGTEMGFQPNPTQLDGLRKVQGVAYGLRAEGSSLKESLFILRPELPTLQPLGHLGMPLTSHDTLLYLDFVAQLNRNAQSLPLRLPFLFDLLEKPELAGVLSEALSGQFSLLANWPTNSARPRVFGVAGVKQKEAAREWLLTLATEQFPEVKIHHAHDVEIFEFPSLSSPLFSPALSLSERQIILALDSSDLQDLLSSTPGQELQTSPTFSPALTAFQSANEAFGYVDLRGLFERSYPMARQMLIFTAALMPNIEQIMDAAKLPPPEPIARHLSPVVFSQTRRSDGYLLESSGPITMLQATALLSASATGLIGGAPASP